MESAVERLVALAGSERVGAYTRHTKTGKTVRVSAYTRDPGSMSNTDLFKEYKGLRGSAEPQKRNRLSQIVGEIRTRQDSGQWGHSSQSAATQAANRVDPARGAQLKAKSSRDQYEENRRAPKPAIDDAGYDEHVNRIKSILKDPKTQQKDTSRLYGIHDPETGKPIPGLYTPERTEQHRKIIQDILSENSHVPKQRKAVMSGGLGGAGKGFVLDKYADIKHNDYITIDPDEMKQQLLKRGMVPEVDGLLPLEQAGLIHEESSDLANLLHQVAMSQGMNTILDTTMASVGSTQKKVQKFKDAGYDVEAVFVDVPVETSISSALGRHRGGVDRHRTGAETQGSDLGGRFVPIEYLQGARPDAGSNFQSKNRAAFEELKKSGVFSRTRVYDNSDRSPGSAPKLMADEEHRSASQQTSKALDQLRKKTSKTPQFIAASSPVDHLLTLVKHSG